MMDIDEIRRRIGEIDGKIVKLLAERFRMGKEIAKAKIRSNKSLWVPEVEQAKLNNIPDGMNRIILSEIFSRIMKLTREGEYEFAGVEEKIAVLGPEGSFSDEAGLRYAKSRLPLVHFRTFREVLDAVERGLVGKAIVPIENSTAGTVMPVVSELMNRDLHITGEFEIPVELCLAGYGTKRIISHPKAIEQCSRFLSTANAKIEYADSTAKALEMIDEHSAAICSEYAAIERGVPILRKGIQDMPNNTTRFVVVERQPSKDIPENPITSFIFWVENRPGALKNVLDVLAENAVNLRKLESRPSGAGIGDYFFLAEAEANIRGVDFGNSIKAMRILGVYGRVEL